METADRLVAHGLAVLRETGSVEAVTIREVARRAGVSHGAPRRYFASRTTLLAALAAHGFGSLTEQVQTAVHLARTPRTRLRSAATAYVDFAVGEQALFSLMFRHDLLAGSTLQLRDHSLPLLDVLVRLIDEVAPGPDTRARSIDFWVALHGAATLHSTSALEVLDIDAAPLVRRLVESVRP